MMYIRADPPRHIPLFSIILNKYIRIMILEINLFTLDL